MKNFLSVHEQISERMVAGEFVPFSRYCIRPVRRIPFCDPGGHLLIFAHESHSFIVKCARVFYGIDLESQLLPNWGNLQ